MKFGVEKWKHKETPKDQKPERVSGRERESWRQGECRQERRVRIMFPLGVRRGEGATEEAESGLIQDKPARELEVRCS